MISLLYSAASKFVSSSGVSSLAFESHTQTHKQTNQPNPQKNQQQNQKNTPNTKKTPHCLEDSNMADLVMVEQ